MNKERIEESIQQYEFLEQEVLTEEQKRLIRIGYKMGWNDRVKVQYKGKLPAAPERD